MEEFEKSISPTEVVISEHKFGTLNHTLVTQSHDCSEPPRKKMHRSNNREWNEGSVYLITAQPYPPCCL